MINEIMVTREGLGDLVLQVAARPRESGFILDDYDIGNTADINMTSRAGLAGGMFRSSRVQPGSISLTLGYEPWADVEAKRNDLYDFFPLGERVRLRFSYNNSRPIRQIWGYVESNKPVIFSEDPSQQISLITPDPYFQAVSPTTRTINIGTPPATHQNTTSIPTGILLTVNFTGNVYDWRFRNGGVHNEILYISGDNGLTDHYRAGDVVTINTERGNKSAILRRANQNHNILHAISMESSWPTFHPGPNVIHIEGVDVAAARVNASYQTHTKYRGV